MGCGESKTKAHDGKGDKASPKPAAKRSPSQVQSRVVSGMTRRFHFCGKMFPVNEANGHTVVCEEREVTCHHSWCRKIMKQKDLRAHMHQCAQDKITLCPKCGESFPASEMSAHRGVCDVVQCEHCPERVIPRMIKYCPNTVFGKLHYRVGPFATERLREKYIMGVQMSPTASRSPALGGSMQFGHPTWAARDVRHASPSSEVHGTPVPGQPATGAPGTGPLAQSQSLAFGESHASPHNMSRAGSLNLSQGQKSNINFQTARVQHLWRWAKAKAVLEDLMFRVVYKELDQKKETFSIFKAHDHRILDEEHKARQKKLKSAAPVQAVGPTTDHYFPSNASQPLTVDIVNQVIEDFTNKTPLPYHAVWRILSDVNNMLKQQPNITRLSPPEGAKQVGGRWQSGGKVVVVGDLHGQLQDLLTILHDNALPSERCLYVFNGDFVDRGHYGMEIVLTLFLLLIVFPKYVALNRGNHECEYMNEEYGFDVEVQTKYDRNIFKLIQRCFCALPLATLVGDRVFIVPGGRPRSGDVTLDEIDSIQRFRQIPMPELAQPEEDEIFQDLMWADPMEDLGWVESDRGVGAMFGPDVTKLFLKTNKIDLVVRSHEEFSKGHEVHHNGKVITVFSASNYDGPNSNMGATLFLLGDSSEFSIHTYQCTEEDFIEDPAGGGVHLHNESLMTPQAFGISRTFSATSLGNTFSVMGVNPSQGNERLGHFCASLLGSVNLFAMTRGAGVLQQLNNERRTRDDVVRSIRDRIYERRHRLLAYFTKIDRTQRGSVWKMEWVETVSIVLNLSLPWFFLRPSFTHTEPITHRIRYLDFLNRFRSGVADVYMHQWATTTMAELYYAVIGRKRHPVAKVLQDRTDPIGYNEFCGLLRQASDGLQDNELFHLYFSFCQRSQTAEGPFVTGKEIVRVLTEAVQEYEKDPVYDDTSEAYCGWDLTTMDQLANIVGRLGSSLLHKTFNARRETPITTLDAFRDGLATLARGSKRPLVLRDAATAALWEYLRKHCVNPQLGVTVDEILIAFQVLDFASLQERREVFNEICSKLLHADPGHPLRRRYSFTFVGFGPTPPAEFLSPAGSYLQGNPGNKPQSSTSQQLHPYSKSLAGGRSGTPQPPGASTSVHLSKAASSLEVDCGNSLHDEDTHSSHATTFNGTLRMTSPTKASVSPASPVANTPPEKAPPTV
jgi:diadenosine tetraphosphatase ApaH/serine/threonine PP2A family protein phosphatase